jgi:hypothetical protein
VKVEQTRPNVFTLTATSQELSALIAAARMALDMMRGDPQAPPEPIQALDRILRDYDAALGRARERDGR